MTSSLEQKNSEAAMALPPERLSRFLTFLLRHKPKEYPLSIDREGFAPWQEVVDLVQERFYDVSEGQIRALIADAEKKRFELRGDKVRATYGHSIPVDLGAAATVPPAELFFGTARDLAQSMLRDGLKPRDRQYVHLSVSAEDAESVAKRHDPSPAIIVIAATAAHDEGIQFYASGPLFLVEQVPPKFLSLR
jgi:putative RNA 2'-phosphotransferase